LSWVRKRTNGNGAAALAGNLTEKRPIDGGDIVDEGGGLEAESEGGVAGVMVLGLGLGKGLGTHWLLGMKC